MRGNSPQAVHFRNFETISLDRFRINRDDFQRAGLRTGIKVLKEWLANVREVIGRSRLIGKVTDERGNHHQGRAANKSFSLGRFLHD